VTMGLSFHWRDRAADLADCWMHDRPRTDAVAWFNRQLCEVRTSVVCGYRTCCAAMPRTHDTTQYKTEHRGTWDAARGRSCSISAFARWMRCRDRTRQVTVGNYRSGLISDPHRPIGWVSRIGDMAAEIRGLFLRPMDIDAS